MSYQAQAGPNYLGFAQARPSLGDAAASGLDMAGAIQTMKLRRAAEARAQQVFPAKLAMDSLLVEQAKEELEEIRRRNDIMDVMQSKELTALNAEQLHLTRENQIANLRQQNKDQAASLELRAAITGNLDLSDDINALEKSSDIPKVFAAVMRLRGHELYKTNPAFRKLVTEGEARVRALPAVVYESGGEPQSGEQHWLAMERMYKTAGIKPGETPTHFDFEATRELTPGETARDARLLGLSPEARTAADKAELLRAQKLSQAAEVGLAEMEQSDPEEAQRRRAKITGLKQTIAQRRIEREREAERIGVDPMKHRTKKEFEAALRAQIEECANDIGDDAFDTSIFKGIAVHIGDAAMLREAAQLMTHPVKGHIGQRTAALFKSALSPAFMGPYAKRSESAMNLGGALRGITERIYRPISSKDQMKAMRDLGDIMEPLRLQTQGLYEAELHELRELEAEEKAVIVETSGTTSEADKLYNEIIQGALDESARSQPVTIKLANGKVVTTTLAVAQQLKADGKHFEFVSSGAE